MHLSNAKKLKTAITDHVGRAMVGKEKELELILVAFLSEGHVLIEDMPGTGKTMMVKSFSNALRLPFKRIQFTPDLLPTDITGLNYYNQKDMTFQFKEGPLFSNIVLSDEINRATPRTQSALLEAMGERQITADGETRKLSFPFMVLATQNPIESYGTFPLPEAQLDRFFMRIPFGLPSREEEKEIIKRNIYDPMMRLEEPPQAIEINAVFKEVKAVSIHEDVMDYLLSLIEAIRKDDLVVMEISPRGSIALFKAAQAYAALQGRDYIIPEDIKYLAPYVLNHRIAARGISGIQASMQCIGDIIDKVTVPTEI